jgi:phosphohistidine swiveling domain-containing protein
MKLFKSKSQTLLFLSHKLKKSIIPKIYIIKFNDYRTKKNKILTDIKKKFLYSKIAIRSSFNNEDTEKKSNAGKYKSFLNISSSNLKDIDAKIKELIKLKKNLKNEFFFVQKMVGNLNFSGVALTRNLEDYSRCININYYYGNNTEAVTSGKFKTKTLIYIENKKYQIPKKFKNLYLSIKEIIKFSKCIDLDIEFAVGKNNKVYILQVRKLIIPKKNKKKSYKNKFHLDKLEKKINKLKKKHHDLLGNTTFFGNMPDWNPAEIIGTKPRPLALSIYQELITDHIWAKNRIDYGYRDLSQFHLMTTFYGSPYIDVRIDFNSWLPANIKNNVSKKIINYYLKTFSNKKSVHDKIEFEILFTCATFSTYERIKKKFKNILSTKEIDLFFNSLKQINVNALKQINKDNKLIEELKNRQIIIQKSNLYEIDKIYWLVEDCKKYGTLPFAGLARCAFIAIELLNSLEENNIIDQNEKINFLNNINTITSEMKNDLINLNKKNFINKYGHLRPGTYDINSENYAQGFEKYFSKVSSYEKNPPKKIDIGRKIQSHIKKLGVYKNSNEFLKFITESIKQREYSKFIFTKSIDLIFKNLTNFGKKYNISNDDLSYVKIHKILDMYFNLSDYPTVSNLKKHIKENKKEYLKNKIINLPDIIKTPKDLYVRIKEAEKINFISNKKVVAKIIVYDKNKVYKDYDGIVCVENADPGYDFLFNKNIKALITKYGGLNSHMAIRCSELNLPALIGVGEKNFSDIIKYRMLKIDCISKKIEHIN